MYTHYLHYDGDDEQMCVCIFRPINEIRHRLEEINITIDATSSRIFAQLTENECCWWKSAFFSELHRHEEEFAYKAKMKFKKIWSSNINKLIQEAKDEFTS